MCLDLPPDTHMPSHGFLPQAPPLTPLLSLLRPSLGWSLVSGLIPGWEVDRMRQDPSLPSQATWVRGSGVESL